MDFVRRLKPCQGGREIKIMQANRYRKLTEVEYFRLMGFTDQDAHLLSQNGISKTQLYKQAGNSIIVPVLEQLASSLVSWAQQNDLL